MLITDNIQITPDILALISRLDEFKGAWRALGTLAPVRLLALRRVATIESIGSSTRIEGSQLSDDAVAALVAKLEMKSFTTRDEQEVAGYAQVMELLFGSWEHITFNENHIMQIHRDLLAYSGKDERHRGQYKTHENRVAAFDEQGHEIATIFQTASPFDTPRLMRELVEWVRHMRSSQALHPLLIVAVFVVVFLEIHPFDDGNGRLSRILTTLLLLQSGYVYVPYSSLESVIEQNKQAYYVALRKTQGTIRTAAPNWQPWITFFLSSLVSQVKRLELKIEREHVLLATMPALSVQLLTIAREQGRLTVAQAQVQTGANRHTIKLQIKKLLIGGHLTVQGAGRGTWYNFKSISDVE
ncbi:MAG: Fic family protein [Rhodoferax sp.]|nr:Fic family protein [Rhodoferax sp.]